MNASVSPDFSQLPPGVDFLSGLLRGAGQMASPGAAVVGAAPQWLMPSMDLDEIDKRIRDLKAVQFWLEQNTRLLSSTIQGLEVQRMTIATLKDMDVSMKGLLAPWVAAASQAAAPSDNGAMGGAPAVATAPAEPGKTTDAGAAAVEVAQWWAQLTQQFGEIAAGVVQPVAAASPPSATSATQAQPEPGAAPQAPLDAAPARKRAAAKRAAPK